MRNEPNFKVEKYREIHPTLGEGVRGTNVGYFKVGHLRIISSGTQSLPSDGPEGWEHVSVSCQDRCPTWEEMQQVKEMFWRDDECVVQFHPPKKVHVNRMPFCLHLWRKIGSDVELPPIQCV